MGLKWEWRPPSRSEVERQIAARNVKLTHGNPLPRIEFDGPPPNKQHREKAEEEAARDLVKPYAVLLADIHDEILNADPERSREDNVLHAQKRLASLTARNAISAEKLSTKIFWLTWVLTALTAALLILAWNQYHHDLSPYTGLPTSAVQKLTRQVITTKVQTNQPLYPRPIGEVSHVQTKSPIAVTTAPIPMPKSEWSHIAIFKGDGLSNFNNNTASFSVGPEWKLKYETSAGRYGGQGSLVAYIAANDGQGNANGLAISQNGSGSGEELEYGAGTYHLQVLNNQSYSIEVLNKN